MCWTSVHKSKQLMRLSKKQRNKKQNDQLEAISKTISLKTGDCL